MIEIIKYSNDFLEEVKNVFYLNVPMSFDKSEWADLKKYLENYGDTYYLLYNNKKKQIIGCGGYYMSSNEIVRLSWDFMNPIYAGMGYGSRLIRYSIENAQKRQVGIKKIEVWTSQYAYKFYEKFNFELVEIKENFWAKNFDLYKMQRTL